MRLTLGKLKTKCVFLMSRLNDLNLKGKSFVGDLQLSDLLVVSAKTDFHDHNLYKAGHIILQDKVRILNASFLP